MSLPVGLATVTVTCGPYTDASGAPYTGTVTFEPSTPVVWTATGQVVLEGDVDVTLGGTGAGQVTLPASDAAGLSPAGFTYRVSFNLAAPDGELTGVRYPFSIQLLQAAPSVVLDRLSPVPTTAGSTVSLPLGPLATMPVPGTPTAGQVLTATSGTAASWQVPSVGATVSDATTGSKGIVQLTGDLSGTAAAPTVPGLAGKAADGAVVHNTGAETVAGVKTFTSAPAVPAGAFPESAVSGLVADLAAKAPTTRTVGAGTGLTGGGDLTADRTLTVSYGTTAGTAAQGNDSRITGALQAAGNLSDVASAVTARTNLGLGTAATQASTAFDAAGAATAAQTASLQKTSNLSDLGSAATARTNLGLGTAATISATAGGDLSGTLPSPTVAKVNGVTVTGTPAAGQALTATGSTAATWQAPTIGFPVTVSMFSGGANNGATQVSSRVMYVVNGGSGGAITRLAVNVAASGGNIDVGVYARSGNLGESSPGAKLVSSGSIPCPAIGYAEITVASTTVAPGDWFACALDNTASGKVTVGSGASNTTNFFKGWQCFQGSTFPLPASASGLTFLNNSNDYFLMKGLP